MTGTAEANRSCTLCDVAKPDAPALRDHVLNVHPDEFCGIYHQQPCEHDRRERYMAALLDADPYALIERRDDRARFADAVMAVADAEVPIVLRMAADVIANHPPRRPPARRPRLLVGHPGPRRRRCPTAPHRRRSHRYRRRVPHGARRPRQPRGRVDPGGDR
jgi:hypothetical protein